MADVIFDMACTFYIVSAGYERGAEVRPGRIRPTLTSASIGRWIPPPPRLQFCALHPLAVGQTLRVEQIVPELAPAR